MGYRLHGVSGVLLVGLASGSAACNRVEGVQSAFSCSDANLANRDSQELFADGAIARFDLQPTQASWTALQASARDEVYTPVIACYNGQSIGTIGMRFKGQVSSLERCFEGDRLVCKKLSLRLEFDKYDDNLQFFGLKRLNLHGLQSDPSHVRERLAYDLYRAAGLAVPRSSWAELFVEGKPQGLFSMVEQIDGRFTASRWPTDGDGDLYKEAWPLSTEPTYYRERLQTNEKTADPAPLVAFANDFLAASPEARPGLLAQWTDPSQWLRLLAVDDAIANWDGITTFYSDKDWRNHNFYIYVRGAAPSGGKPVFDILPWDMDNTFQLVHWHSMAPHWREPTSPCPHVMLGTRSAGCDPILATLALDEAGYRNAVHELLTGPFRAREPEASLERHVERIREAVKADPLGPTEAEWNRNVQSFRSDLPRLRDRLSRLADGPPVERVVLSAGRLNDFSGYDELETQLSVVVYTGTGSKSSSELSPTDSPLSGIRFVFDLAGGANNWAYYAIALEQPDSDLRDKKGVRFRARALGVSSAAMSIASVDPQAEALQWKFPLQERVQMHELLFNEIKTSTDGGAPQTLDVTLQHVERIAVTVSGDGTPVQGFVEIDDFELF